MNPDDKPSPWAHLLALPNDSTAKILLVAVTVCLVCSIMVATAAVMLRPLQQQNEAMGRQKEILKVAGLYQADKAIGRSFEAIETRYVDIHSGEYVSEEQIATQEMETIPPEEDIAAIGQRLRYQPVYLVQREDSLESVILPLLGKGLWSSIHGFVALAADGNTVKAITFYDHAETPGLGGEISRPTWQAKWQGKKLGDQPGHIQLHVVKGAIDPTSDNAPYEVDALSGATLTANGITRMVHYWLGETGFGSYLAHLRSSQPGAIADEK